MINAAELIDNLVAFLRDIPDLVAEMEGNPERIIAYHHRYPKQRSLEEAKHGMPAPGIMVAHLGPRPGSLGGVTMWHHRVSLYLRTRETFEGDPPGGYYRLWRLISDGIATSHQQPLLYAAIHPSCELVDLPEFGFQSDAEGLDYCECVLEFREK